ncbi:MAG: hypothetical protein AABX29_09835 [Nanoarchaeota archaeon]
MIISDRVIEYNKNVQKNKYVFFIKRAVMSDHEKEFHNIDSWRFFYSKESREFINHLSYWDKTGI